GTVVLSRGTYEAMLTDMATSLRSQGFQNIILIGDSGGNQRSMATVADALSTAW
ncbi:MAG TPA: creatininase, partial [Gemmatimonadetes bacterium]|nr:creatininase [Gemmatimonadota bacterium]